MRTPAPSVEIHPFVIPGEGQFVMMANYVQNKVGSNTSVKRYAIIFSIYLKTIRNFKKSSITLFCIATRLRNVFENLLSAFQLLVVEGIKGVSRQCYVMSYLNHTYCFIIYKIRRYITFVGHTNNS